MQRTIPIQPGESVALLNVRGFAAAEGFAVLYTTNGQHDPDGYHPLGQAADLADPTGPGSDTPALLRINRICAAQIEHRFILELIYGGRGGICIKNGEVNRPPAALLAAHLNHVHLAVRLDYRWEGAMPDDPNIPNGQAPVVCFAVTPTGKGYWIVTADGAVFAFGDALYLGRIEAPPRLT